MTLSDQIRDLPSSGSDTDLMDSLDIANCLRLFDRKWNDVFKRKLSLDYRTWAKELMGIRNKTAHIGIQDYSENDTWRALDTMARLCEAFDDEAAEEIRKLLREARYGSAEGSTMVTEVSPSVEKPKASQAAVLNHTISGLPSWREVIEPHPDVAQGRYKNAEFAADLAQVARGEGSFEYRDPVEFFARTYVTEGMTGLLVQALKRVRGKDGEPVIQLKTAFGGGKTTVCWRCTICCGARSLPIEFPPSNLSWSGQACLRCRAPTWRFWWGLHWILPKLNGLSISLASPSTLFGAKWLPSWRSLPGVRNCMTM